MHKNMYVYLPDILQKQTGNEFLVKKEVLKKVTVLKQFMPQSLQKEDAIPLGGPSIWCYP